VTPVEDLGLPELTTEQVEELCAAVDEAARKYVLSKVPSKHVETLDISVEAEGAKPLTLKVGVDIALSPNMKNVDAQRLADEAIKEAFTAAEKHLRELTCRSKK